MLTEKRHSDMLELLEVWQKDMKGSVTILGLMKMVRLKISCGHTGMLFKHVQSLVMSSPLILCITLLLIICFSACGLALIIMARQLSLDVFCHTKKALESFSWALQACEHISLLPF